jgi:3-dehydroquinate dehydratase type I
MICACIAEPSLQACIDAAAGESLAEIRLDLARLSIEEVDEIFGQPLKLIATCRPGPFPEAQRLDLLKRAVRAGAAYLDIEIEAAFKEEMVSFCRAHTCAVIVSYHNYVETPPLPNVRQVVNDCFDSGADIAKVACLVQGHADSARLLALYDDERAIVALGMGELAKITRVAAPLLGAPFTYASVGSGQETAPGQIDSDTLRKIITDIRHA